MKLTKLYNVYMNTAKSFTGNLLRLDTLINKMEEHGELVGLDVLKSCFIYSMMTVKDENDKVEKGRYHYMCYVEFLEFLCRVALNYVPKAAESSESGSEMSDDDKPKPEKKPNQAKIDAANELENLPVDKRVYNFLKLLIDYRISQGWEDEEKFQIREPETDSDDELKEPIKGDDDDIWRRRPARAAEALWSEN